MRIGIEHRLFGPTDRLVPIIGQRTWYNDNYDRGSAIAALRRGLDLGMTHIDTSEMYGSGAAEEMGAEAISGMRQEVFLVSQVLPQHRPAARRPPRVFDWDNASGLLCDTDVLPAQFFPSPTSRCPDCPEADLMRAVLTDTLACFQKGGVSRRRRVQRLAREAEAWLLSDDDRWPFSFGPSVPCWGWNLRPSARDFNGGAKGPPNQCGGSCLAWGGDSSGWPRDRENPPRGREPCPPKFTPRA